LICGQPPANQQFIALKNTGNKMGVANIYGYNHINYLFFSTIVITLNLAPM
jgi:hypothetical protein